MTHLGQNRKQATPNVSFCSAPIPAVRDTSEVRLPLRPFVAHPASALGPKSLLRDPSLSQTREISDLNQIADLRRSPK